MIEKNDNNNNYKNTSADLNCFEKYFICDLERFNCHLISNPKHIYYYKWMFIWSNFIAKIAHIKKPYVC